MKGYTAFVKKEFIESLHSYRLLIFIAVFLILGMMNPLTAKLTPVLMDNFMPTGTTVEIGEPTALDSWMQFYKNVPQMGLALVIILFSGIMSREYSKGTLIIVLTRGLSRAAVILSKFTVALMLWTVSLALCFIVSWAYTAYFWQGDGLTNIIFAVFCLWVFGIFILSCLILGGAIFTSTYGNLVFTAAVIAIQFVINILPQAYKYNPLSLASKNLQLLQTKMTPADMTWPLAITAALIIAFVAASVLIFNKKKL